MTHTKRKLIGLCFLAGPCVAASPAAADRVQLDLFDQDELRAYFHSADFTKPCPLAVYNENMSKVALPRELPSGPVEPAAGPEQR